MAWKPGKLPTQPAEKNAANRKTALGYRQRDSTDYEQRHFGNLVAAAFVLALALAIGWTVKIFDSQMTLERCLESGRKECRQITVAAQRGYVHLNK